jgi:hypothetical protein
MNLVEHANTVSAQRFGTLERSTTGVPMSVVGPVMATPAAIAAFAFGLGIGVGVGRALAGGREPREPQLVVGALGN